MVYFLLFCCWNGFSVRDCFYGQDFDILLKLSNIQLEIRMRETKIHKCIVVLKVQKIVVHVPERVQILPYHVVLCPVQSSIPLTCPVTEISHSPDNVHLSLPSKRCLALSRTMHLKAVNFIPLLQLPAKKNHKHGRHFCTDGR